MGVTPKEMVFEPGFQDCGALLSLGRGWGVQAALAGWTKQASAAHVWGVKDGVRWLGRWSQDCKVKSGQVAKSIRTGTALGTFLLLSWLLEYVLILDLRIETREPSRILDWKIWETIRLHLGSGGFFYPPSCPPPLSMKQQARIFLYSFCNNSA